MLYFAEFARDPFNNMLVSFSGKAVFAGYWGSAKFYIIYSKEEIPSAKAEWNVHGTNKIVEHKVYPYTFDGCYEYLEPNRWYGFEMNPPEFIDQFFESDEIPSWVFEKFAENGVNIDPL